MATYRLDGFSFNRDNLRGVDADAVAGLNRYLNARERELNTITTMAVQCVGGPFDGQTIELEHGHGRSSPFSVGQWSGCYVVTGNDSANTRAEWQGIGTGPALENHQILSTTRGTCRTQKELGKGYAQLAELLARMAEAQEGETAVFTIGRTTYRVPNNPEAIERLRARILKAKKWFSDKNITAAPAQRTDEERATEQVREVIAEAVAAVAIEQAAAVQDDSAELETVGAAQVCAEFSGEAGSPAITSGHASSTTRNQAGGDIGRAGQTIKGKSGVWSAVFYLSEGGRPAMQFTGPAGTEIAAFDSGSDRMAALQRMARQADAAAPTKDRETSGPADEGPRDLGPGALSITITRAEGSADECGKPETVASFADADAVLMRWSETAPATGGYDKCDFSITWPDGGTYRGRYDLKHHSAEQPSLTRHMVDLAEFYTGQNQPEHMTAADYQQHLASVDQETREAYAAILGLLRDLAGYFPRARPVAVDLRTLTAQGLDMAQLVGLGVAYAGDMANAGGAGAITTAAPCQWYGIAVTVTLEDGRELHASARDFGDGGHRFRLDLKRHGAPYLAQLQAARAARTASETSARQMAADKHARDLERLAAEYPQLQRTGGALDGLRCAAANIRTLLKAEFPGVKFSVKSRRFSGGDAIDVEWIDGPTGSQVDAIIDQFSAGSFDGQTDSYNHRSSAFTQLFGDAQYIHSHRRLSDAAVAAIIAQEWAGEENPPTVADYRNGTRRTYDHANRCRVHMAANDWSALPAKA